MKTLILGGQNGSVNSAFDWCNGHWRRDGGNGHVYLAELIKKMVFDRMFRVIELGAYLVICGFSVGVVLALLVWSTRM